MLGKLALPAPSPLGFMEMGVTDTDGEDGDEG